MTQARRRFGPLRHLPSGRWQARYKDAVGHMHAAPLIFATKRDAERFLVRTEADMERGDWQDPRLGRITFAQWVQEYLDSATHRRATTVARDHAVLEAHLLPALGRRPVAGITQREVQQLVNAMAEKLAPATIRTHYGVLRAVLSAAVQAGVIGRSPCRGIKLPRAERRRPIRFLTAEELQRLAWATPLKYRPMVFLAGLLGLRWSEVAGLRVGRVDLLRRTVTVSETMAEVEGMLTPAGVKSVAGRRTLELPPFLIALLAEHFARAGLSATQPDDLVFTAPAGGPVRETNFRSRVWAPALREAQATRRRRTDVPSLASLGGRLPDRRQRVVGSHAAADGGRQHPHHPRRLRARPAVDRPRSHRAPADVVRRKLHRCWWHASGTADGKHSRDIAQHPA